MLYKRRRVISAKQCRVSITFLPMKQLPHRWPHALCAESVISIVHTIHARSMTLAACYCKELNFQYNVNFSSASLHCTRIPILCVFIPPNFKCYHNICSHSHLPPNLVVLPHLGQADGGWGFSSSSNMSCQPTTFTER
jgi:hypothetical protein